MNCWRCDVALHAGNDIGICRLCELEVDGILQSLVRTWRYSEDRLFKHRGTKGYKQKKLDVYSTLIYTYVWKMRMIDKDSRQPVNVFNGDYRDAAGLSMLANVDAKDFLAECWESLIYQQLVNPRDERVELVPGVPDCSI